MTDDYLMTVREAAAYLGLRPKTLYGYMSRGVGPVATRKLDRFSRQHQPVERVLFRLSAVDAWKARRRGEAAE